MRSFWKVAANPIAVRHTWRRISFSQLANHRHDVLVRPSFFPSKEKRGHEKPEELIASLCEAGLARKCETGLEHW